MSLVSKIERMISNYKQQGSFIVLDLYAGLGGTARGIQKVLKERKIKFLYLAVEWNYKVAFSHKKNNPDSYVIIDNTWNYLSLIHLVDFLWASPPCQSHSRTYFSNKSNNFKTRLIDWSLWGLIDILMRQKTVFVVENVIPWYKCPFEPILELDRHYFWSNITLVSFYFKQKPAKDWSYITVNDWQEYHQLEPGKYQKYDRRQQLRNCVHETIAAGIFEQFLTPKQKNLDSFLSHSEEVRQT